MQFSLKTILSWGIVVLGIGHILMGIVRFRLPFSAALEDGLIGAFSVDDSRRVAVWFTLFGPALALCGHLAVRAAAVSDLETLKIVGIYMSGTALFGLAAFPYSPLWALLALSISLIAVGYGWMV
jgi:hypothetical protein